MGKYHIQYVEECSIKTRQFNSLKQLNEFIKKFVQKYGGVDDGADNYIQCVFKGKILNIETEIKVKE